jgi:hypothetical protein
MNIKGTYKLCFLILLVVIGINLLTVGFDTSAQASLLMITPYADENDIESINEAFSIDDCAPWGFGDHLGIDFMPTGLISLTPDKPFRAVCDGTVQYIDLFCPDYNGSICPTQWQVNVEIQCSAPNSSYSVRYAFETWSTDYAIGEDQLNNIQVNYGLAPGVSVAQGDVIGDLIKAGIGAHVHFSLQENGYDICPETYFESTAQNSILNIMSDPLRHPHYPDARICYGLEETIPTTNIVVDGNTADWAGINAVAGDRPDDDLYGYNGADIEAIYLARDAANLYIRMDLYDNVNPNFGNGPDPDEGRYGFYLENNGPFPFLYLGVAYDQFNSQWSLGYNGSNGPNTPGILIGPSFIGVSGNVIEIMVPLSIIGSPLEFTHIKGEVVNCCVAPEWYVLDETHCVSNHHIYGGSSMLNPQQIIQLLIDYIETLTFSKGTANGYISKLESAIKSLAHNSTNEKSLTKKGKKVFDQEKKAVKILQQLIKDKKVADDVKDVCEEMIDKLVTVDKLLAETALNEAKEYEGTDKKVDKEIEKSEKELKKATKELEKGKPDKAIDHYKKAWEHAQHAMK